MYPNDIKLKAGYSQTIVAIYPPKLHFACEYPRFEGAKLGLLFFGATRKGLLERRAMEITKVMFEYQIPLYENDALRDGTMEDVVKHILNEVSGGKDLETAIRFTQSGNIGDAADLRYYIGVAPLRRKNGIIYGLHIAVETSHNVGDGSRRCEFSFECSVEVPEFKRISRREIRKKRRGMRTHRIVCR